jgi:hypothetical protein
METNAIEPAAETVTEGQGTLPKAKPPVLLQAVEGGPLAIMPRNIEEAARYASGLIAAGIVPDAFKKNGDPQRELVMMGVLKSLELGVAPQTGLAGLLPLNGRFSVWGDLAAALVQRTGLVKDQTVVWTGPAINEDDPPGSWSADFGCEVRYWRVGQDQPYIGRFTVRDAKRADLWMNPKRQPWIRYPKRMLFNRARAFAIRDGFADGLCGLTIAEEVLDALPPPVEERGQSRILGALTEGEEATDA